MVAAVGILGGAVLVANRASQKLKLDAYLGLMERLEAVELGGALKNVIAIAAGIIIAQRRPIWSAVQPQNDIPKKLRMFAIMNGTAVPMVVRCRSDCRCVANKAQIE